MARTWYTQTAWLGTRWKVRCLASISDFVLSVGARDNGIGEHGKLMQQPRRLSQVIVLRLDSPSPKQYK